MATDDRLYLFLDTNVFLHFRCFDEIDWQAFARRKAGVVVAHRPVIDELDRHANDNRQARRRERARTARKKIEALVESGGSLRNGTTFTAWLKNPTVPAELDQNYPDDLLIASALQFAAEHGADVAIVAADTGVRLKARRFALTVLRPSEPLPDEPDERELELRRLKALPRANLGLTYADGQSSLTCRVFRQHTQAESEIRDDAERDYHLARHRSEIMVFERPEWVRRRVRHRIAQRDHLLRKNVTFRLDLSLQNDGTGPADDIHVKLVVPHGLVALTEEEPEPQDVFHTFPSEATGQLFPDPDYAWRVLGDGRALECRIDRVKQRLGEPLEPLFLRLQDIEQRGVFTLNAELVSAEPPLNVNVSLALEVVGL